MAQTELNWRWLGREEIDDIRWDQVVKADSRSVPYGLTEILDARCVEWGGMVLGNYEAVFPLPFKKRWGLLYSRMPFGLQQLGIFGPDVLKSWIHVEAVLKCLPKRLIWLDIHLHEGIEDAVDPSAKWKWLGLFQFEKWHKRRTAVLEIAKTYEEVHRNYSGQTAKNVKKATSQAFTWFEHDSPEVLIRTFRENQMKKYTGISAMFLDAVSGQMNALVSKRRGVVHTVYGPGNQLYAGAFWWFQGDRMILYFSAITDEGRTHQAMSYLINEALIQASGTWRRLDFEGSQEEGLHHFYLGWGAETLPYLRLQRLKFL